MNNDNKDFDPMLSIPSMEELDRQWREREAAQNYTKTTSRKNTTKRTASGHNNARNNAQRRTMAEAPRQSNKAKVNRKQRRAKEKKPKKFKKFRLFLKIFLLIFLIACLGVLMVFYFKYGDDLLKWKKEAKTIVEQSTKKTFQASETSMIYASNKK